MQEQMNSMNDSGDFQDVESNESGRLSHVSSQFVMIPSSRFLEINLPRLIRPETSLKEFNLTTCKETVKQSLKQKGRSLVTQVKTDKIKAQFQCRHLQQGR